jgi:hypothetical protein
LKVVIIRVVNFCCGVTKYLLFCLIRELPPVRNNSMVARESR